MRIPIDLTGQKFGKLTVIKRDFSRKKRAYWICQCECGNTTTVASCDLRSGHTQSCGCKCFESHNAKHKMKHTRIYNIWCWMRKRCNNQKEKCYKYYGGEGKTVCHEWDEFLPFYQWAIENGYNDKLSIDRIDINKGYSPDNCRWATPTEQNRNRRNTVMIKNGDKFESLPKLCEELNFSYTKALQRTQKLRKDGIPLEIGNVFY